MSNRSERERQKTLQEKFQAILADLLKDEDNKYCVDCDAKGPRWASWNLGVFLCIRCAGIHRNLGVHISKVKSVNLDTWAPEQIGMLQEMGNSRARAVYEANLPDTFRRPQTDSSLESFIRAKYEQKKYIAKEWIPPKPKIPVVPDEKKEKKRTRPKPATTVQLNHTKPQEASKPQKTNAQTQKPTEKAAPEPAAASVDLLGLDTPAPSNSADPFGDFLEATPTSNSSSQPTQNGIQSNGQEASNTEDLFGESAAAKEEKKSTKESILALYGSGGQSQAYNVPGGMYMSNQGPQMGGASMMGVQMPAQGGMMPGGMQPVDMQTNLGIDPSQQYQQQYQQQQASQQLLLQQQQAAYLMQQQQMNMMMSGQMGGMPQQMGMMPGMPQQGLMGQMMPQQQPPAYNNMMATAYAAQQQQQQQHLNQVQNQLASMKLNQGAMMPGGMNSMGGFQQQGTVAAGAGWGVQPSGQTLSNNLWQ